MLRTPATINADPQTPPARMMGDQPVHTFHTLLSEMATLTRNTVTAKEATDTSSPPFDIVATPTDLMAQALAALSLTSALA